MVKDKCCFITSLILLAFTAISGTILVAPFSLADDSVIDELNITVPESCSLSGTGMDSHTAEISIGTYNSAIGETTIKAFCNDNEGFAIYAVGFTDDEAGKNVLSSSTLGSAHDIATGTLTSGNTSQWAMKLSTISNPAPTYPVVIAGSNADTLKEQGDPDFSTFQEVPDNYAKVAYRTSGTDAGANAEGATITTTYQAYISPTQAAGTYTGKVKYVLIHPSGETAPTIPEAIDPSVSCTTPVPNLTYMQDLNSSNKASVLASMMEDEQYFLKDARDEKRYCVAKLKDGNIWMTQNLDHNIVTTANYYTNENTDIGWNSSTNSYNTTTWTADSATLIAGIETPSTFDIYSIDYEPLSFDVGDVYVDSDYINSWVTYFQSCDTGTTNNCDSSLRPANDYSSPVTAGNQHYHVGNYYNWTAAVALNDTNDYNYDDIDVNRSICPANWTLPKDYHKTGKGSTRYLLDQYGYTATLNQYNYYDSNNMLGNGYIAFASPLYLNLAGFWEYSEDQYYHYNDYFAFGSWAYYWESSSDTGYSANSFSAFIDGVNREDYYFEGTVSPFYSNYRSNNQSIRCVSR